jgi:DNA-binding PadR family transcriptional regulator
MKRSAGCETIVLRLLAKGQATRLQLNQGVRRWTRCETPGGTISSAITRLKQRGLIGDSTMTDQRGKTRLFHLTTEARKTIRKPRNWKQNGRDHPLEV